MTKIKVVLSLRYSGYLTNTSCVYQISFFFSSFGQKSFVPKKNLRHVTIWDFKNQKKLIFWIHSNTCWCSQLYGNHKKVFVDYFWRNSKFCFVNLGSSNAFFFSRNFHRYFSERLLWICRVSTDKLGWVQLRKDINTVEWFCNINSQLSTFQMFYYFGLCYLVKNDWRIWNFLWIFGLEYQNKHWTIRHRDGCSVDPLSQVVY